MWLEIGKRNSQYGQIRTDCGVVKIPQSFFSYCISHFFYLPLYQVKQNTLSLWKQELAKANFSRDLNQQAIRGQQYIVKKKTLWKKSMQRGLQYTATNLIMPNHRI